MHVAGCDKFIGIGAALAVGVFGSFAAFAAFAFAVGLARAFAGLGAIVSEAEPGCDERRWKGIRWRRLATCNNTIIELLQVDDLRFGSARGGAKNRVVFLSREVEHPTL